MRKYTFVVDYIGGTYLAQIDAQTLEDAIELWVQTVNLEVMGVGSSSVVRSGLATDVHELGPVSIIGLSNVWCISPFIANTVATVHIVATLRTEALS